jgi:predicted nucleic acid-binding protein
VSPGQGHWPILCNLLRDSGTAGNLTSDAHLAAVALQLGASVCSTDRDFERFSGVERINPLREQHPAPLPRRPSRVQRRVTS